MKICIMIIIAAMTLISCVPAQINVDSDSQEVVARIAARHVGYELQKKYPDVAKRVLVVSENILIAENDVIAVSVESLTSILVSGVTNDPLLAMDIQDLVALVKVDVGVEIPEDQIRIVHAVAKGLISGIRLYTKITVTEYSGNPDNNPRRDVDIFHAPML